MTHGIWNPWHGCIKCSPGCENCYMYYLDKTRSETDGRVIHRNGKALFNAPVAKDRAGNYKIKPGTRVKVCMTSDFFLKEADEWRPEAWELIRRRPDVIFWLLTKRPERILECLPPDWGEGYENIIMNVTAENQEMADKRMPILEQIPARHKGVCVAPWIGPVSLRPWLEAGWVEEVAAGGENYDGCRPCDFEWVKALRQECVDTDTTFCWYETGTVFIKDGRVYQIPSKSRQSENAFWSGMNYQGRRRYIRLRDPVDGHELLRHEIPTPEWCAHCITCANRLICTGCGRISCNRCGWGFLSEQDALARKEQVHG